MKILILFALHSPFAFAGLECRGSEIKKVLIALKNARISNCANAEHLRLAGQALRELATEPSCDRSAIDTAQRKLAEARVAPLMQENENACVELLNGAESHIQRLTTSVKTGSNPSGPAP